MSNISEIKTHGLSDDELLAIIEKNRKVIRGYLDLPFIRSLVENVLELLDEVYFRSEFIGFDELPERPNADRPIIYASNHSGMAFPWDAIMFSSMFYKRNGYDMSKTGRPLTAPMLSKTTLMNPFLLPDFWKRAGGVDATSINFETLMNMPESDILIYPEGIAGIGKGFNRRYQLQRFSTSILRMSIKYKTDIIPFATINGEYINPYVYSFDSINRQIEKLGIPFLPIGPLTLILIFQPWLFYFAFPAKLTFVMGERIRPYELLDKPFAQITQEDLDQLRDKIHVTMQQQFDIAVKQYGKRPYQWKEFWARWRKNWKKFPYFLPFGWPIMFSEFDRQYHHADGKPVKLDLHFSSVLHYILRNPITIAYFIPILGWIPMLMRGYRNSRL